jgi:hypothetical protein
MRRPIIHDGQPVRSVDGRRFRKLDFDGHVYGSGQRRGDRFVGQPDHQRDDERLRDLGHLINQWDVDERLRDLGHLINQWDDDERLRDLGHLINQWDVDERLRDLGHLIDHWHFVERPFS